MEEDSNIKAQRKVRAFTQERFKEMVAQYEKPLTTFVFRMTKSLHDAQDLVQTTFIKALKALHGGDTPQNLRAWLYKIAYTTTLKHFKRREIENRSYTVVIEKQERAIETTERITHMRKQVLEEITKLPDTFRKVALLRFCQHLKIEEIAEIMDIPLGTAKVYVSRAVKELRKRLQPLFERGDLSI